MLYVAAALTIFLGEAAAQGSTCRQIRQAYQVSQKSARARSKDPLLDARRFAVISGLVVLRQQPGPDH